MNAHIGRNDPCPCGSGKKYKKCCMLKQGKPPAGSFDEESLREYGNMLKDQDRSTGQSPTFMQFLGSPNMSTAWLKEIQEQVRGMNFDSVEDYKSFIQTRTACSNARPVDDFLGLSPDQIHSMLQGGIEHNKDILCLNTDPDENLFADIPAVRQIRFVYEKIAEDEKGLRATQKGNLPLKLVREFYDLFVRPDDTFDLNPRTESHVLALEKAKYFLIDVGLIRYRHKKYSSTVRGREVFASSDTAQLYLKMFYFFMQKLNWLYGTAYPEEMMFIQRSRLFCLYILKKKADDFIHVGELAEVYIEAFPRLVRDIGDEPHIDACSKIKSGFTCVFMERVAMYLGLVEERKKPGDSFREKSEYRTTRLFSDLIQWQT